MRNPDNQQHIKYPNNVGSFMDADMLAHLEPNLNRHFMGTPKNPEKTISNKTGTKTQKKSVPPPLPEVSSASDIYTKKIASFKRKLKTLKGVSTDQKDKSVLLKTQVKQHISQKIQPDFKNNKSVNQENEFTRVKDLTMLPTSPFYETSSPTISNFNVSRSDINLPNRKQAIEKKCSICNLNLDSFYNIEKNERIIELRCNHMVHEECLIMDLEFNISVKAIHLTDQSVLYDNLPICSLCTNSNKALPKNDYVLAELFTKMITSQLSNPNLTINSTTISIASPTTPTCFENPNSNNSHSLTLTPPEFETHVNSITNDLHRILTPRNILSQNESVTDINFEEPINFERLKSKKLSPYKKHSKRPSRGSYASGTSAIVTSVSKIKDLEESTCISNKALGQKFINEVLIMSAQKTIQAYDDENFVLSEEFIRSLGRLKIVDKLQLYDSQKDQILNDCYCFLFDHMLLALSLKTRTFFLISINRLTNLELIEQNGIIIKANKSSENLSKLIFESNSLREKWYMVMTNSIYDRSTAITTSLAEDEFDHLIVNDLEEIETIGTLQSYIGDDGYRRLATGVCPRFYEGTINSLLFKEKPSKVVIVLNQSNYIPQTSVPVKNIVASLSMIGIDILLILASCENLTTTTAIVDSHELKKQDFKTNRDQIYGKIDEFQEYLQSNIKCHSNETIDKVIQDYISNVGIYDSIVNIYISNTSLKNVANTFMLNQLLIEVGLDSKHRSNRSDVDDLASWDDVMEVVCTHCGLEFDESDFYVSSEEETDTEGNNDDDIDTDHIPFSIKFNKKEIL